MSRRPVESIAPSLRTTGERITVENLRRGRAQLAREKAEREAAGLRAHNDPDNPWTPVFRVCDDTCPQHGSTRPEDTP